MTRSVGKNLAWLRPQVCFGVLTVALLFYGLMSIPVAPIERHHVRIVPVPALELPDCRHVSCIALTFDDGPNPKTTPKILDTLEREHVPATFFVVGLRVAANAELIRRMHKDRDEIGNHSWSHPNMTMLKPKQIRAQVTEAQLAIERAGAPAPTLFRPPFGDSDGDMRANISLTFMFWNEDPHDWAAHSSAQVAHAVEAAARPGGVIDMHDIYNSTADALPKVVRDLRARHYHFVTVSQLLELHPGQRGDFYGRMPPKGPIP